MQEAVTEQSSEELSQVDTDALVRESQALREQAARLLNEARVVQRLGQYGEVEVGGSYRGGLMIGGDIDCYVINPACDLELALGALTRFIREGDFSGFAYIDSVRHTLSWEVPTG